MPAARTGLTAVERYRRYGDRRPDAGNLEHMINEIKDSGEPEALCSLASMCIDLALSDSSKAPKALEDARTALQDAADAPSLLTRYRLTHTLVRSSRFAVTANLLLADLDNWELAAEGQPPANRYATLVTHGMTAARFAGKHARAALAEGIPLLLGLRRYMRTDGEQGWLGRLSLDREDRRHSSTNAQGNRSWDVAAVMGGSAAATFIDPSARIQVKLTSISEADAASYRDAGIVPISAKSLGFAKPEEVVLSCAHELTGGSEGAPCLSTPALDDITDRLIVATGISQPLTQ